MEIDVTKPTELATLTVTEFDGETTVSWEAENLPATHYDVVREGLLELAEQLNKASTAYKLLEAYKKGGQDLEDEL